MSVGAAIDRVSAGDISFLASGAMTGRSRLPLVCLHGIGGDAGSFGPQLRGLAARRRILSWDMPGYGASAPLAEMDFAILCDRLCAALDVLEIERAIIAGQSIGGMIAQEMAIRHPQRVAGLVLIATVPAFGGRDDSFKQDFLAARLAPLDRGVTMRALAEEAIPAILGASADEAVRREAIAAMAAIPEPAYRQVLQTLVTFNRRGDQHRLTCPCCLIAGGEDDNSPARVMAKMAGGLAHATFHIVETAGHLVNSEAGVECNAIIDRFLDGVQAQTESF